MQHEGISNGLKLQRKKMKTGVSKACMHSDDI